MVRLLERLLERRLGAAGGLGVTRDPLDVVVVDVAGVRCGLPAADVVELHPVVLIAPLPGAPGPVEGVVDRRGSVVPVVDLRARLGLPARPPVLSDHLVFVTVGSRVVALRVDRALDLVGIPHARIEATPEVVGARHVSGVARVDDGLVLIHDLAAFLSTDEAIALDAAMAAAEPERRA